MVKIITLNVNGRIKILTKLQREKTDIAFLQEKHLTEIEHNKLKGKGFKHVFSSPNTSKHNRGVSILISVNIVYEHLTQITNKEGTFNLIKGKIDGVLTTLYNIYAPPGSGWEFYQQIFDKVMMEAEGITICGGDFNLTLNPNIDSSGSSRIHKPKNIEKKNTQWQY